MVCPICSCRERHNIDMDLMSGEPIESVLMKYKNSTKNGLTMEQLKVHAVCHIKVPKGETESIATKLAYSEAETLATSCSEYLATLQRLGAVINSNLSAIEAGEEMSLLITKPFVDLYLGAGVQLRENIKLLTEAYADAHSGEADARNRSGITMLSAAIERSRDKINGVKAV